MTLAGMKSIPWSGAEIARYDAALICTDHDCVDYKLLAQHAKLVFDSRNAMKDFAGYQAHLVKV